jgi:hypothetical protein
MTRVCSGCGLHSCDGRCYLECAADYADDEYTEWLARVEAEELELQAKVNRRLEPKRRAA